VRVAYYCQDSVGLGHVRRTIDIADHLAGLEPDVEQLIISGTPAVGSFSRESGVDALVLPDWGTIAPRPADDPSTRQRRKALLSHRRRLREALVDTAVAQFAPAALLVDNSPIGVRDELALLLLRLRSAPDRPTLFLGFRDFLGYRGDIVRKWHKRNIYDHLRDTYDRIFIFGQREVFDFADHYAFPPDVIAKTLYCGYVKNLTISSTPEHVRTRLGVSAEHLVVVTVGGGDDGEPLLRHAVAMASDAAMKRVHIHLVTGPLTPLAEYQELSELASATGNLSVERFNQEMHSLINAADAVISMGGYNTMIEVAGLGKRAIVAPRHGSGEQDQRAARFAELELVHRIDLSTLTAHDLAAEVRDVLLAPPPTFRLDLGGLERVGSIVLEALRRL
jgi:predicted glycosyltransferase